MLQNTVTEIEWDNWRFLTIESRRGIPVKYVFLTRIVIIKKDVSGWSEKIQDSLGRDEMAEVKLRQAGKTET